MKQFRQHSAVSSTHKSKVLLISDKGKKKEREEGEKNNAYL